MEGTSAISQYIGPQFGILNYAMKDFIPIVKRRCMLELWTYYQVPPCLLVLNFCVCGFELLDTKWSAEAITVHFYFSSLWDPQVLKCENNFVWIQSQCKIRIWRPTKNKWLYNALNLSANSVPDACLDQCLCITRQPPVLWLDSHHSHGLKGL